MNKVTEVDFLIVGQGLAGSALAMRAIASKHKILVMDQPGQNRSSLIAAGLVNPFTGRKMSKTWMADNIFPALFHYYQETERLTGKRFFYPTPLYRPFGNIEEQNEWMGKSSHSGYNQYIAGISLAVNFLGRVKNPYGGVTFKQTAYLDTGAYLAAVRQYLETKKAFVAAAFEPDKLEVSERFVRYGDVKAEKVIFCQGVYNEFNPWFKHLPIRSLKGELLTVQSDWQNDVILNRGVFMVPGSSGQWIVGSTYNRSDQTPIITSGARDEIVQKLEDLISMPYRITGQQWGVRPTTPDRKPILGAHDRYGSLIIFNGLGTKGVSLAPYFSAVLVRWMNKEGAILEEADVSRFN